MTFFERLERRARLLDSALCVGLDPRLPEGTEDPCRALLDLNRRVIEATAPYALCYKPNAAFYERWGEAGQRALKETIALVPEGIPVLLDAKRGDIEATAAAYAQAAFGELGADAITLSPYMGRDAAEPFLAWSDKGLFLLARTSNPGAAAFQELRVEGGEALYLRVARECLSWSSAVGLVVAGNDLEALRAIRAAAPSAWFLSPGIGSQGGDAGAAFAAGARADGAGILVVAARSVAEASDPAKAAEGLRDAMRRARDGVLKKDGAVAKDGDFARREAREERPGAPTGPKTELIDALISTGCFRLGDFVLKSGKRSPFYLDLRRLVSDPQALGLAGRAYAELAARLSYDRIAGIPAAALPLATAASLAAGRPMIWPRMPAKEHGTGNRIEGAFAVGERALLLDDLVTTGLSKFEAAEILRGEGLVVEDLVVLVERGKAGRRDLAAAGIKLHAYLRIEDILERCETSGLIDAARRAELEAYLALD